MVNNSSTIECPLCHATDVEHFHRDRKRDYLRCGICLLIFVPPAQRLSASEERAVYELHQNSPDDAAYRKFLGRLFNPLKTLITTGSRGLDFGCGPGPTLSLMFEEAGFPMSIYDAFYENDRKVLESTYDFITCTEVVEHLHEPGRELSKLWSLLKPGGWFGIMTKLQTNKRSFANWHYIRDPTHVCYFPRYSFQWLAKQWQVTAEFIGDDVVLIQKNLSTDESRLGEKSLGKKN